MELFDEYETTLKQLTDWKYLAELSEHTLFHSYKAALLDNESNLPLLNFNEKHKEMLYRLKFRALDYQMKFEVNTS